MLFEDRSLAPYQGDEPYLFLSYSHRNADAAAEAIRYLKAAGFRVWYDEGVIPATEWDENIARAIENCDYLIALISEAYLASSNCLDELNYARDRNIPLLLIYLEDVALPSGLAMRLGRLLAIHRYRYDNPAVCYSKVVRAKGIGICGDGRFEAEEEEDDDADPDAYWLDEDEETVRRERPSFFRPFFLILLALVVAGIAFLLLRGWAGERVHGIFGTGGSTVTEALPAPDPTPYAPPETSAEIEIEATPTPTPSASPEPSASPSPSPDPTPTPTPTPTPSPTPYSDSTVVVVPDSPSPEATPTPTPTPTGTPAAEPEIVTPSPDVPSPVEPTATAEVPAAPQESTAPVIPQESAEPTPTPTPSPTASPAA